MVSMRRKEKKRPTYAELKAKTGRVQSGALIDADIWQAMRVQGARENRSLGLLLDDACKLYLKRKGQS